MRIILSCLQSQERHAIASYEFWRTYFIQGCIEADIECVEVPGVDWAKGLVFEEGEDLNAWRSRTWDQSLTFIRREHARKKIDFFLGYLYPRQVDSEAVAELHRLGIPTVNFFCDNVREFKKVPKEFEPFALHWVPEYEALPMYQAAGLAYLNAPMPCWIPDDLRSVPSIEADPPTFIGSADLLRTELLGRAIQSGADLVVRGSGWLNDLIDSPLPPMPQRALRTLVSNQINFGRTHGIGGLLHKAANWLRPLDLPPVDRSRILPSPRGSAAYNSAIRGAMISIGVNRVHTAKTSIRAPLKYSRLRDIEAPMLGACYLTEWTQGLEVLYDVGVEIESYRTVEELCEKLLALKGNPTKRMQMRRKAQRRALSDHTVEQSLKRIISKLDLR